MKKQDTKKRGQNQGIDRVEGTRSLLVSEGGVGIFVRYLRESGIIDEVTRVLGGYVKRNRKGVPAREMIEQVMAYIAQDCKRTIEGFNAKKKDKGYLKLCGWKEHVSADAVWRMMHRVKDYEEFEKKVNDILRRMVRWGEEGEAYITIGADSKSWKQAYGRKREGVEPTYAKEKGYHPLMFFVNGMVAEVHFRRGSVHCNAGDEVMKGLKRLKEEAQRRTGGERDVVVRMDAGFFDGENFKAMEEEGMKFVVGGRVTKDVHRVVEGIQGWDVLWDDGRIIEKEMERLDGEVVRILKIEGGCQYRVGVTEYGCSSWERSYGMLAMRLMERKDVPVLFKGLLTRVAYTNMTEENVPQGFVEDYADEDESWVCALARFYHGRGEDELTFRRMLEVWSENLPFLNYEANAVFFCFLALTLNALMLYWENVLRPLHGETLFARESYTPRQRVVKPKRRRNRKVRRWIYVRTLQEMFFHIPGRIVHRGRSVILQVPDWLFRHLRLDEVFDRVCRAGPVFVT